jgi:hypothetical protein
MVVPSLTFSLEVDEQGDPGHLLLALGQLCEDEESLPPSSKADTLQGDTHRIQVVFCDTS